MLGYEILNLLFSTTDDLKDISDKIIPSDPWAIVTQLVATFFLVLILAKFLVKPVRKYIAERQAYIQGNIDEANLKNEEANSKIVEAETMLKDAKKTSKELVENAKVTALNEKDRILLEAKDEANFIKEKARSDMDNEKIKMQEKLSAQVIDVALAAASKVVEREISSDDSKKIIENFIKDDGK